MDIKRIINALPEANAKAVLAQLLERYLTPAFAALPKNEVELLVLDALEQVGAISADPQVYELVSKLKVTRPKARRLIYDRELRHSSSADLDAKVKALLKRPLLQKQGELFVLEVENPLVSDHLRDKLQQLGYACDGSFSPSLIKLGLEAITALIAALLSTAEQEQVRLALVAAGAPDDSFRGVLKATLKKLASKVAADSGEALLDKAAGYLAPIVDASIAALGEKAAELFAQ
ncbi:MAG: hypothetical protein A3F73_13935 [Gallionellales bacterium RIFCSPLOWO2_12_FULL_59_22]|nr:MAG: hypothetical protein A3F73_13935 [Gallionellales bacterium RIFCSPLOWO2_12_FULL_59_22]